MKLAAVSGLPMVAESATTWKSPATFLRRRNPTVSWTPLLLSTRLWSSSTTTALTSARLSRILLPGSMAWRVSGVVTRTSGGSLDWRCLWACGVSPCLTSRVSESLPHQNWSLRSMSRFSARRGVM